MGSSQLIEFLVAVFVAFLAILGGLFCIGFLLVDPVRSPIGIGDTQTLTDILQGSENCSLLEVFDLPENCTYMGSSTITLQSCPLGQCSTPTGVCSDPTVVCCCRAFGDPDDLRLGDICPSNDAVLLRDLSMNVTACGCSPCSDVVVVVRVTVISTEGGLPVSAARIFDTSNDTLLGITLLSGEAEFEIEIGDGSVRLLADAPDFFSIAKEVTLTPQLDPILVTISVVPRVTIVLGPGESAIALRLGDTSAALSTPQRAFVNQDNTSYSGLVQYSGMIMNADDLDLSQNFGPNQFEIDEQRFALIFLTLAEFLDDEMNQLGLIENLTMTLVLGPQFTDQIISLVVFNETADKWEFFGFFDRVDITSRKKRQDIPLSPTVVRPDVPIGVLVGIAIDIGAECWLQARTFRGPDPFPNGFVTLTQRLTIGGFDVVYRFGTTTGNSVRAENAVCLPLDCDSFDSAVLVGRRNTDAGRELGASEFPRGTFTASQNEPIIIGNTFYFEDQVFTMPTPKPFYPSLADCELQSMEDESTAVASEYFAFNTTTVDDVFPNAQCYIRVKVLDCYDANMVNVRSLNSTDNSENMDVTVSTVADTTPVPEIWPSGDLDLCMESEAIYHAACVPFTCTDILIIQTAFDAERVMRADARGEFIPIPERFCDVSDRAVGLAPDVFNTVPSGLTIEAHQVVINTSPLGPSQYNDPLLGLYHSDDPATALAACLAGDAMVNGAPDGAAVTFNCLEDP